MASRDRDDAMAGLLTAPSRRRRRRRKRLPRTGHSRGLFRALARCGRNRACRAALLAMRALPRTARRAGLARRKRQLRQPARRRAQPASRILDLGLALARACRGRRCVIAAVWATRRPELTRIAEHPEQAPATVATSLPPQQPFNLRIRKSPLQNKHRLRRGSPRPCPVQRRSLGKASPARGAGTGFGMGVPAATAEDSRSTNAVVPKSAAPDELSKKAAQQQASADQAANTPSPNATSESVTVESETSAVAGAAIAPSPARTSPAPARTAKHAAERP